MIVFPLSSTACFLPVDGKPMVLGGLFPGFHNLWWNIHQMGQGRPVMICQVSSQDWHPPGRPALTVLGTALLIRHRVSLE